MSSEIITKKWHISIDIEKLGPLFNQPLIAVGIFVGDESGRYINGYEFCFLPPNDENYKQDKPFPRLSSQKDLSTLEWWTKDPNNLKVLEYIRNQSESLETGFPKLVKCIDNVKREAKQKGIDVEFLSDNPAFDLATVDYHIFVLSDGMKYGLKNGENCYYSCEDPLPGWLPKTMKDDIRTRATTLMQNDLFQSVGRNWKEIFKGEHHPLYDAAYNFYLFFVSKEIVSTLWEMYGTNI